MEIKMISTNNAPVIKFRSKFQRHFERLPQSTQSRLVNIFARFIDDQDDVRTAEILWRLTYNHFAGLCDLGIREQDKLLNDDILTEDSSLIKGMLYTSKRPVEIPSEMIEVLRNELRYQRKKRHPNFLVVHYPEGCKEAFTALLRATNDPILTYEACVHCYQVSYCANDIEINRILYLLSCTKKENIFGGIRSLKFDKHQSELFLKYAQELHDYLEAVWIAVSTETKPVNTPLANQLEALRNAHPEVISDETVNEVDTVPQSENTSNADSSLDSSDFADDSLKGQLTCLQSTLTVNSKADRPLSAKNILDDATMFQSFLNVAGNNDFVKSFAEFAKSVKALKAKGYDYTEAIEILPRIEALLSTKAILEGA